MNFVGIDPGLDGALAVINSDDPTRPRIWDTPTGKVGTSKSSKRIPMPFEMRQILYDNILLQDTIVFIEKVHAMQKQGVTSMFNFGLGYGLWIGIVTALGLSLEYVTPQKWMKEMMAGRPIGKDAQVARAQELWPSIAEQLVGPRGGKKDGRADALLIAEYGRRTYGGSQ